MPCSRAKYRLCSYACVSNQGRSPNSTSLRSSTVKVRFRPRQVSPPRFLIVSFTMYCVKHLRIFYVKPAPPRHSTPKTTNLLGRVAPANARNARLHATTTRGNLVISPWDNSVNSQRTDGGILRRHATWVQAPPASGIVCGLVSALSTITTPAIRAPVVDGANRTSIVQPWSTSIVRPVHDVRRLKSRAAGPASATREMTRRGAARG